MCNGIVNEHGSCYVRPWGVAATAELACHLRSMSVNAVSVSVGSMVMIAGGRLSSKTREGRAFAAVPMTMVLATVVVAGTAVAVAVAMATRSR